MSTDIDKGDEIDRAIARLFRLSIGQDNKVTPTDASRLIEELKESHAKDATISSLRQEVEALREALDPAQLTLWAHALDEIAEGVESTNEIGANQIRHIASGLMHLVVRARALLPKDET